MATALIIKNGDVYLPEFVGKKDILSLNGKIQKLGDIDRDALDKLGIDHEIIDATNAVVVPGFIDPHQHLVGGDGEGGFSARTPVIQVPEIVLAGITTVVGCLGTDNITFSAKTLLGHVKGLNEEGLTAYMWVGGYTMPPGVITESVRTDMMFIPEVIGAGETAVSDLRSSQPTVEELARLASDAYNGGLLTKKCGATHFHMGDGKAHLTPIFELLDRFDIDKTKVYPTHIGRNDELLKQACELSRRGVNVNLDTVEEDLVERLQLFVKEGGVLENLTFSSDASVSSPSTLYNEVKKVLLELRWPLEKVLPFVTTQTARVLHLSHKGALHIGYDSDVLVLEKDTYDIRHVVCNGKVFVRDGEYVAGLRWLENSNRKVDLHGSKKTAR